MSLHEALVTLNNIAINRKWEIQIFWLKRYFHLKISNIFCMCEMKISIRGQFCAIDVYRKSILMPVIKIFWNVTTILINTFFIFISFCLNIVCQNIKCDEGLMMTQSLHERKNVNIFWKLTKWKNKQFFRRVNKTLFRTTWDVL